MRCTLFRRDGASKRVPFAWLRASALAVALVLACCLTPSVALAGPALDIEQRFAQPDGTTFRASLHGDEYFSYVQTADGHLVQKDSADQTWYYVVDEGAAWSLGPRADEAAPASALAAASLAGDASKATYAALGGSGYADTARGSGDVVTLADIEAAQGSSDAGTFGLRSTVQTETSLPLITIVIGFDTGESDDTEITANGGTWTAADQRYRDDYDWYEQLYGGEYSITNFYATMSNGQFSWVPATAETSAQGVDGNTNQYDEAGDGIIHVTLDRNHGNWKSPREEVVAANMREAYAEALHKASAYIDFSAYDTNGNGVLDKTEACILFISAGYEASAGASSPATWAFQWNLGSMDDSNPHPEVVDDVALDSFITMGETLYAEDAGIAAQPMSVGTVSHELGHYLGLPDLYDVNATASDPDATIGAYPWIPYDVYAASLMATGSWGRWTGDDGTLVFAPSSMDAYCLETLGYIEPTTVAVDGTYDVSSFWSEGGYRCLRIPTSSDGEYFLVENRQYESFDKGLTTYYRDAGDEGDPAFYSDTAGIVVWHIDQTITSERDLQAADLSLQNTVNTVDHRPGVMPVYLELPAYDNSPLMYRPFYNADTFAAFGLDELSPLLHNGCATPAERIASGITLDVDDDASDVMKVTVDMPEAQVTSLTPEVTTLGREGGAIEFAVAGQNLFDGVELRVYDETGTRIVDAWATASSDPSDDPSARTATIAFPENVGDTAASYTVRAAYAGEEGVPTAAVSVEGRYAQRALSASLGDMNVEVAGAFSTDDEASVALSALSDEQVAELAAASDQVGGLVAGANVAAVNAAGEAVAHTGKLSVTFTVGAAYEGKTLWFAHGKADGTVERAKTTVQNGRARMSVDELSPFAVFEQKAANASPAATTPVAKPLAHTGDHAGGRVAASLALCAGIALVGARISRRAASRCRR